MKRSMLGLLASLVLGVTAVVSSPVPANAGAAGVDVAQVQPADHDGKDKCGDDAKDKCEAKCGAKDKCEAKCGDEAEDRCEAKGEGKDKDGDDKDGDDKEEKKGCPGDDDKDRCWHKGGDDGERKGDKDRHRDGDGRRCVGLIVICIG